ncbi:DUF2087 domain-containing protein [Cereibacter changlensis]|uniref:DUF2087 domain-containing protein n=2 Tax=Cereibacter changlensis TaxID=402884 RepID=A0A4U0Z2T3_9RHOB|nr:DUF2087 domain-containing protein [Cereibacter changlensis]TKA96711.1 DUF2087 domain-containing protein [Cereibacter changlensis]
MPRHPVPLSIADLSSFSRALAVGLRTAEGPPSHLALMNLLARAAGFRNFQHLRAEPQSAPQTGAGLAETIAPPSSAPETVDQRRVERALRQFAPDGQLARWPSRRALQELCLWVIWSRLPAGVSMAEPAMNAHLNALHLFGDPALLRRDLVDMGLFRRAADGTDYRRIERAPSPEALAAIRQHTGLVDDARQQHREAS